MKIGLLLLIAICAVSARRISRKHPLKHRTDSKRIVGGESVSIDDYGYQVSLQIYDPPQHFCGGSILTDQWILTAGHCWPKEIVPEYVTIRAGSSDVYSGGTVRKLLLHIIHPDYDTTTHEYDASLVYLDSPLPLNGVSIRPIGLISVDAVIAEGTDITTSGWGYLKENGGVVSETLQAVTVPIIKTSKCKEMYKDRYKVTDSMICALDEEGKKDSCEGDSGGPAIIQNGTLVGIVSWGAGCARADSPGVYTRIANKKVRDFIKAYTFI